VSGGYAEVNGARLYYETAGEGPAIVLLHSGLNDATMWDAQFESLAGHHRVVRYDNRGFGRSSAPPGPAWFHRDLAGLLDHLGIERVTPVGVSMGGTTALDFAIENPDRVDGLVLVGSGMSGRSRSEAVKRFSEAVDAVAQTGDIDAANEMEVHFWVDGAGRGPKDLEAGFRARAWNLSRAVWQRAPEQERIDNHLLDPPARGRLGEVPVPALVVTGELDVAHIQETAAELVDGIAGAQRVVIEGAAHLPSMERPDAFNRALGDYLRRRSSRG